MRIRVLLNRDAGSLRPIDVEAYARHAGGLFEKSGHDPDVRLIDGKRLEKELEDAAGDTACEAICVCGGDGSVSASAGVAWRSGKVLAVIPGGTMNLFARTLGIPLDIHDAVEAVAAGTVRSCDIASVNGRAFVHQFSVGLHPRMVESRKNYPYRSRASKIIASIRGAFDALQRAPRFEAELSFDGGKAERRKLSVLACSNNRYGKGHLPYADFADRGELGVYLARPMSARESIALAADIVLGIWDRNELFEERVHKSADIRFLSASRRARCVIDGELLDLPEKASVRLHHGELKVLMPASNAGL